MANSSARTERYYVLHGLLLVGVVALVALMTSVATSAAFSSTARVTALMGDIGGGMNAGADVKMRGAVVGTVADIEGSPGHLSVVLEIDKSALQEIPSNVVARVLPASVFGTSFVDLNSPAAGSRHLVAGDVIQQDASAATLDLQKALDSIDKLVKALGPAQLSAVLHALAGSLDGRGSDIGSTIDHLNHVLSVLNPQIPLIQEDAQLLATNMQTLQQAAPDLLSSLTATADVARGVVANASQARALLVAAIKLVDDGSGFLDANGTRLIRAILQTAGVTQAVYDNRTGVSAQVKAIDDLMTKILTITDGGPIRVNISLINTAPYTYYTAADCPRYGSLAGSNCK